jgi:flagellar basal body rod protein FlgG
MDGIAWAGSAMVAARTRLEVATENLANVSTDGFRRVAARGFLTPLGVSIVEQRMARQGGAVHAGTLATNGVNAIAEMIDVLAAERSFESAQKVVSTIDMSREKAAQAAHVA